MTPAAQSAPQTDSGEMSAAQETSALQETSAVQFWARITGDGVNVRTGPTLGSTILGTLNRGDRVYVRGWANGDRYENACGVSGGHWREIDYGGGTAWVASGCLLAE
ncbi:SH3 domain-containing protein [Prauserella aidingensis]|uniref:SH3 domain-containing protein n=1 Tax=Prauserella aidingensis TaxID=387890 RepID=UPI0020A27915|nr:SH3 domain-containing protein [Prauserella aidingensis]MCP2255455.1 SH3 domain-containing protein [Prauserella aidingensis]